MPPYDAIGLALSGGGIRAAVFHLGVLKFLATKGRLESVSGISTVSGGSLGIGLVYTLNNHIWPTSPEFLTNVMPSARQTITSKSLLSLRVAPWLVIRHPIQTLFERAKLLSHQLQSQWKVSGTIGEVGPEPIWHINTTNYETGKNWRFSQRVTGDWKFGRTRQSDFSLADALAASAAVPYAIGALRLSVPADGWHASNPATGELLEPIQPPLKRVRLWDGGVYENLGIEPLYKPGRGLIDCSKLIVSDAGAALQNTWGRANSGGLPMSPRLFDLSSDQIRSLRARVIIEQFAANRSGLWLQMGKSVETFSAATGYNPVAEQYMGDEDVANIASEPTHLRKLSEERFDAICRLGYETAHMSAKFFWPNL